MNTEFTAAQGQGKTAAMVATVIDHWLDGDYTPEETYGNVAIDVPGYNLRNNQQMREILKQMLNPAHKHKLLLFDECDRIFPARFFADKQQTEDLVNAWQDEKMFHTIYYTSHLGLGVDKILRDATNRSIKPVYDQENDLIELLLLDQNQLAVARTTIENISRLWKPVMIYNRWQVVQ